jgi:hypothetical protein
MAGLATALGQTFQLPRNQPQQAAAGQQGAAQQGGGSILGAPPTGLQNVEGVTDAFYKKWGDLESFASRMKMQYGIDVTRPDFSSQEAMDAHKIYQQGLADVRFQGGKLQQAQKDLTQYQGQAFGATGEELTNTMQAGQVFDPATMVTRQATPSAAGKWTDKDAKLEAGRNRRHNETIAAGIEREIIKAGGKEKSVAGYKQIVEDLGSAGAGITKWNIDEDGIQKSNTWQGKRFGKGTSDNKIIGFERNDNGEVFLVYGGDRVKTHKKLPVNESTMIDIYTGYIDGQYNTATERREAMAYLEGLEKEGLGILDMAREDTEGYLKQAEDTSAKYSAGQKEKTITDLTEKADTSGNLKDFEFLIGKGEPKVVGVESMAGWKNGFYRITFESGEPVIIGGTEYGDNNQVIREILSAGEIIGDNKDPLNIR